MAFLSNNLFHDQLKAGLFSPFLKINLTQALKIFNGARVILQEVHGVTTSDERFDIRNSLRVEQPRFGHL
jgi:hypothetical protein